MKQDYISLIPAKKNSSRLKDKNMIKIKNKFLFEYTLEASLSSKKIYETYVSSDNSKILNISSKKGAKPFNRPKKFSKNNSTANEVILNFISFINKKKHSFKYIVYLQPTSPLRNSRHISDAIKLSKKYPTHTIISAYETEKSVLKSIIKLQKNAKPLINKFFNANDQILPRVFYPNGAIYIFSIKDFLKIKKIPLNKIKIFEMKKKFSIDINYKKDLKYI